MVGEGARGRQKVDHAATADERDGRAPVRGGQRYNEEANAVMYPAMRATIPPPTPHFPRLTLPRGPHPTPPPLIPWALWRV